MKSAEIHSRPGPRCERQGELRCSTSVLQHRFMPRTLEADGKKPGVNDVSWQFFGVALRFCPKMAGNCLEEFQSQIVAWHRVP